MSFRVSFGLAEILGIFGSWALVQSNWGVGIGLLCMSVFGVFCRYALEVQAKKESNEKIETVANSIKDALFTSTWGNQSSKNMH